MSAGVPNSLPWGKHWGAAPGWVLLSWSPRDRKLVNQWASDHCHTLAGGTPILALDMYEHSYHIDFGAKAATYVDTFMAAIRWKNTDQPVQRSFGGVRGATAVTSPHRRFGYACSASTLVHRRPSSRDLRRLRTSIGRKLMRHLDRKPAISGDVHRYGFPAHRSFGDPRRRHDQAGARARRMGGLQAGAWRRNGHGRSRSPRIRDQPSDGQI